METKVFIHISGELPRTVSVKETDKLSDIFSKLDILSKVTDDVRLYVANCEKIDEDEVQSFQCNEKSVDINDTVGEVSLDKILHLNVYSFEKISVSIGFGSEVKKVKIFPWTTIDALTEWAKEKHGLDSQSDATNDYILECKEIDFSISDHVGDKVSDKDCEILFELTNEITPLG